MSFHVNPETGRTGQCSAKIKCKFNLSKEEHFETREEAQKAFESSQGNQIASARKKSVVSVLEGTTIDASNIPDINGVPFTKAWKEKFKKLTDYNSGKLKIENSYPESLLSESVNAVRERGSYFEPKEDFIKEHGDSFTLDPKTEYLVVVSARQGGGNRDCYCELDYGESNPQHEEYCLAENNEEISYHPDFLTDVDDDFDSTYNYFYFDNGITRKDVEKVQKDTEKAFEINQLERLKSSIKKGENPAWAINASEDEVKVIEDYKQSQRRFEYKRTDVVKAQEELKELNKIQKSISNGKLKEEDIKTIENLVGRFNYREHLSTYDKSSFNGYLEAKKKVEDLNVMKQEAFSLKEDSPLRKFLLEDRGSFSYNTTEGKGRSKRTVLKTVHKGSLFDQEMKEAQGNVKSYKDGHDKVVNKVNELVKERKSKVDDYVNEKDKVNKLRNTAWSVGWPGNKKDVPAPPESF